MDSALVPSFGSAVYDATSVMQIATSLLLFAPSVQSLDFAPPRLILPEIEGISWVVAGDLDADGDQDIVLAGGISTLLYGDEEIPAVLWHENLGGVSFAPGRPIDTGSRTASLVDLSDVDGDGDLDVVHVSSIDRSAGWTPQVAPGEFGSSVALPLSVPKSWGFVRAVDIDLDGDEDLIATANSDAAVYWWERTSNGQFQSVAVLANGVSQCDRLAIGDLDGDGDLDILTADATADGIVLFENDGAALLPGRLIASGLDGARALNIADFDGDGLLDIVLGLAPNQGAAWIRNAGAGTWEMPVLLPLGNGVVQAIEVIDIDRDGDTDIAVAGSILDIHLIENLGDGSFAAASPIVPESDGGAGLVRADVDGDGIDDLITSSRIDNGCVIALGDGSGGFGSGTFINRPGDLFTGLAPCIFDIDGDGDVDVVIGGSMQTEGRGALAVFACEVGTEIEFDEVRLLAQDVPTQQFAYGHVLPGDLDGDQKVDIVVRNTVAAAPLTWCRNLGNGAFADRVAITAASNWSYRSAAIGDIDGDGDVDVMASDGTSLSPVWWANSGDGTFSGPSQIGTGVQVLQLELVDLDGDGRVDILQTHNTTTLCCTLSMGWRQNLGGGVFGPFRLLLGGITGGTLTYTAIDMDLDGDLDIVPISHPRGGVAMVQWFEQVVPGSFSLRLAGPPYVGNIVSCAVDLDRDGILDFVASCTPTSGPPTETFWLQGLGNSMFGSGQIIGNWAARYLQPLDIDGDSDEDILLIAQRLRVVEHLAITGPVGSSFCAPAPPNSSGASGQLQARGSSSVGANSLRLVASNLPPQSTAFCLTSREQGFISNPGGSQGNLCLAGQIGRGVGGIANSGTGIVEFMVDVMALPQPGGVQSALRGSTWSFQCWHRDLVAGQSTSNFTNAVAVRFE